MENIQAGFDVFLHDGEKAFGAVRQMRPGEIVVYVENTGDFAVKLAAIKDVHDDKVVLDPTKLDVRLIEAIRHAHAGEDRRIP